MTVELDPTEMTTVTLLPNAMPEAFCMRQPPVYEPAAVGAVRLTVICVWLPAGTGTVTAEGAPPIKVPSTKAIV